jgi:hypothetical protein
MDPKIVEALRQLDPKNDAHWNDGGLPSLDELSKTLGRRLQRSEVNATAPELTRDTFGIWLEGVDDAMNGGDDGDDEQVQADASPDAEAKAEMDEAIEAAERNLERLQAKVVAAQKAVQAASEEIDAMKRERAERFPAPSPAQAMKEHIARLAEHRQKRVEAGGLAPIDAALRGRKRSDARKNALPTAPLRQTNPLGG